MSYTSSLIPGPSRQKRIVKCYGFDHVDLSFCKEFPFAFPKCRAGVDGRAQTFGTRMLTTIYVFLSDQMFFKVSWTERP